MALEYLSYSPEFESTTQQIVRDIERRTGLDVKTFNGLKTKDATFGPSLVPILCEWAKRTDLAADVRRGLSLTLMTPYVYPFLDTVLAWWRRETDNGTISFLIQTLAYFLKDSDAPSIWQYAKTVEPRPFYYLLMESLSKCPSVSREVRDAVVHDLSERSLSSSDIAQISRIRDPRIVEWFRSEGAQSQDARIRSIANKVTSKSKISIPVELSQLQQSPDRSAEVFSTEIDLKKAPALLRKLSKQFGLLIPPPLKRVRTLESLELDHWYRVNPNITANSALEIWLRLEDVDVIEIFVGPH